MDSNDENLSPEAMRQKIADLQSRLVALEQLEDVNYHLQQSRDVLRTIIDRIDDGILLIDHDGRTLAVNVAMATLLGRTIEDMISMPLPITIHLSSSTSELSPDSSDMSTSMQETVNTRPLSDNKSLDADDTQPDTRIVQIPHFWILRSLRDGRSRQKRITLPYANNISRVLDMQALPILHTKMSGQKRTYQVLLYVVDKTEQLHMDAIMIENEQLATMRRMTQIVAHEVNTPLQTILTMLERMHIASAEKRDEFLAIAQEEIHRIGSILHELLDTYRPLPEEYESVNISRVVERVLLLTSGRLAKFRIQAQRELTADVPPILGRSDELTQVVLNLVINAIESMPDGGSLTLRTGVLEGETCACQDETAYDISGTYVTKDLGSRQACVFLDVVDSGVGIPLNMQRRVFEPFFTTREHGTGLGLFVSQKIITNYGGSISVRSTVGEGTMFRIVLPIQAHVT